MAMAIMWYKDKGQEKKSKPNIPQDHGDAHSCKHQRKECKYTPAKLNRNMVEKQTCKKGLSPSPKI